MVRGRDGEASRLRDTGVEADFLALYANAPLATGTERKWPHVVWATRSNAGGLQRGKE